MKELEVIARRREAVREAQAKAKTTLEAKAARNNSRIDKLRKRHIFLEDRLSKDAHELSQVSAKIDTLLAEIAEIEKALEELEVSDV